MSRAAPQAPASGRGRCASPRGARAGAVGQGPARKKPTVPWSSTCTSRVCATARRSRRGIGMARARARDEPADPDSGRRQARVVGATGDAGARAREDRRRRGAPERIAALARRPSCVDADGAAARLRRGSRGKHRARRRSRPRAPRPQSPHFDPVGVRAGQPACLEHLGADVSLGPAGHGQARYATDRTGDARRSPRDSPAAGRRAAPDAGASRPASSRSG